MKNKLSMIPKIDAIVPCYNEKNRLGAVLKTLTASRYVRNVIFIDDGSTDSSLSEAQKFPKITIVHIPKKSGKGDAVKTGVKKVLSPVVLLCDADITGFTEKHIVQMYTVYRQSHACMVVGLREKGKLRTLYVMMRYFLPLIAGERLLAANDLKNIVMNKNVSNYGLEPYMNYYFNKNRKKIIKILLRGVNDIPKWKKESYSLRDFFAEAANISGKYLQIYTRQIPKDVYENVQVSVKSLLLAYKNWR